MERLRQFGVNATFIIGLFYSTSTQKVEYRLHTFPCSSAMTILVAGLSCDAGMSHVQIHTYGVFEHMSVACDLQNKLGSNVKVFIYLRQVSLRTNSENNPPTKRITHLLY